MHGLQRAERAVLDKGQRAFVSHVRAYSRHECNILLQAKELPLGQCRLRAEGGACHLYLNSSPLSGLQGCLSYHFSSFIAMVDAF